MRRLQRNKTAKGKGAKENAKEKEALLLKNED